MFVHFIQRASSQFNNGASHIADTGTPRQFTPDCDACEGREREPDPWKTWLCASSDSETIPFTRFVKKKKNPTVISLHPLFTPNAMAVLLRWALQRSATQCAVIGREIKVNWGASRFATTDGCSPLVPSLLALLKTCQEDEEGGGGQHLLSPKASSFFDTLKAYIISDVAVDGNLVVCSVHHHPTSRSKQIVLVLSWLVIIIHLAGWLTSRLTRCWRTSHGLSLAPR